MSARIIFPVSGFCTTVVVGDYQLMFSLAEPDEDDEDLQAVFKAKISNLHKKGDYPSLGWIGIPQVNNKSCDAMVKVTKRWIDTTPFGPDFHDLIYSQMVELFEKTNK